MHQLQILAYVYRNGAVNTDSWELRIRLLPSTDKYYDIFCEVFNLYNVNLLKNPTAGWTCRGISELRLSPLGLDLVSLAELNSIPEEEIAYIASYIDTINSILASH